MIENVVDSEGRVSSAAAEARQLRADLAAAGVPEEELPDEQAILDRIEHVGRHMKPGTDQDFVLLELEEPPWFTLSTRLVRGR